MSDESIQPFGSEGNDDKPEWPDRDEAELIGRFHVCVDAVESGKVNDKDVVKLTFTILGGTNSNAKGRQVVERLYLTKLNNKRVLLFLYRLGLITDEDLAKGRVQGNWCDAVGRQVIVEIGHREFERQDGTKGKASNISYAGIWRLDNEAVKDVPRWDRALHLALEDEAATEAMKSL